MTNRPKFNIDVFRSALIVLLFISIVYLLGTSYLSASKSYNIVGTAKLIFEDVDSHVEYLGYRMIQTKNGYDFYGRDNKLLMSINNDNIITINNDYMKSIGLAEYTGLIHVDLAINETVNIPTKFTIKDRAIYDYYVIKLNSSLNTNQTFLLLKNLFSNSIWQEQNTDDKYTYYATFPEGTQISSILEKLKENTNVSEITLKSIE